MRKEGRKVRLQAQPFQLLVLLLRNAGRVVSREDVRRELWPGDTFVDFDHGLAAAVNKIRDALCDSADKPKFVETLPRRGYRFMAKLEPDPPVEIRLKLEESPSRASASDRSNPGRRYQQKPLEKHRTRTWAVGSALILLGAGVAVAIVLLLGQKKSEPAPAGMERQPIHIVPRNHKSSRILARRIENRFRLGSEILRMTTTCT